MTAVRSAPQLATPVTRDLVGQGLVSRASEHAVRTGADRVLPVREELLPLLPWPGLRRGATIALAAEGGSGETGLGLGAPGSTSLLLALLADAVRAGSWCAVVGVPGLGGLAAAELGIDLGRLAVVPYPGVEWLTVTAALLDGLEIVVMRPPGPIAPKLAQRLAARAKQRGSVLISYGSWSGADITLRVAGQTWHGLEPGRGRLRSRELAVTAYGRRAAARPRSTRLWLPAGEPGAVPEISGGAPEAPVLEIVEQAS